ncbi:hypothetical protein NQ317_004786 [Molorchus minor]|uniref:Uncharacterized protein n=1 Tax=Molorchus minor TaxID=1323400 RepID=A0ABQ9JVG6_9CUCU|nr:hypothetical protein NQ317_004786 [Molorchus minor]
MNDVRRLIFRLENNRGRVKRIPQIDAELLRREFAVTKASLAARGEIATFTQCDSYTHRRAN